MEVIAGELPDPAPVTIATLPLTLYGCECSVSFLRPRCRAAMVMPSFSKAELVLMLQSINRGDNTVMMDGAKHNPSSHQPAHHGIYIVQQTYFIYTSLRHACSCVCGCSDCRMRNAGIVG
jgi:hypothetical protein